ncbi:hypothetical protein IMQ36_11130 [Providencia rettgeri]|nr:hypothetical protein H0904_11920 [Providencia rettgeri]QPE15761.1 hypothetical protein IMQ36_11130 [Providencia rettgeri]
MVMLFQDRVIELLKGGQSMSLKAIRDHFESNGIKVPYCTAKNALNQLEQFNVVLLVTVEEGGIRAFGYKLNDNYETGLARQASSSQRHKVRASKPKKAKSPVVIPEYGPWCQTGEPARLQIMLNKLLAKPRAKRIKRGLAV